MSDFHLYKGAWVCGDVLNERELTRRECRKMLNRGGYFVRNVFDFDCGEPTSFWYVIKDSFVDLSGFSKKNRGYIKRAYEYLDIGRISRDEMLAEAYNVYVAAFGKYTVKVGMASEKDFRRGISDASDFTDFWGCRMKDTGKLVAFMIAERRGDICEYKTSKADPAYLPHYYPLYGLYYARDEYYLSGENPCRFVISGSRSITEHSNIQSFLEEKFFFRKAYCRMRIYYVWWLRLLVKLLYPFRNIIPVYRLRALFHMEAMSRGAI